MKKFFILFLISISFFSCFEKQKTKKKLEISKPNGIWVDLILGGPPLPNEFVAIDKLTKKYKINYKRIEMGCEYDNKYYLLQKKYELDNAKYFKELESTLGKNWKQNFDSEKHKLDSLNIKT